MRSAIPLTTVCCVLAASSVTSADRAVGRTARLAGGTIELGLGVERSARVTTLHSEVDPWSAHASQVVAIPRLRMWLGDWVDVELRQPLALARDLEINGASEEVQDRGALDTEVRLSAMGGRGRLVWGGAAGVIFPTADGRFGTERPVVTATLLSGWRLPFGVVHLAPSYSFRNESSSARSGDIVAVEGGYEHRIRGVSLAPSVAIERTRALVIDGAEREGAFTTWRVGGLAALELIDDLTAGLALHMSWAEEHAVGDAERGGGREWVLGVQLTFAWDLWSPRARATHALEPAAIRISDVRIDGRSATRDQVRDLRVLVPRLRLATLEAEHAAGGARGQIRVVSAGGPQPGSTWRLDVVDATGVARLADAVTQFFRETFPGWARTARLVEFDICFDRCAGPDTP